MAHSPRGIHSVDEDRGDASHSGNWEGAELVRARAFPWTGESTKETKIRNPVQQVVCRAECTAEDSRKRDRRQENAFRSFYP